MKLKSFLTIPINIILLLFIIYGCANRKSPTGGEKDIKGPELITSIPANKSLNFKEKKLYLEFDEFIKEDNLTQKIVISPALDSTFSYKIIKKKLTITFNKSLKENTTYTLNLGEAIKDITEGNPATKSKLVFSTGPLLDSLHISGTITNLQTGQPIKEALVALYNVNDTITPFNGNPMYIAKTDDKGIFNLENLKEDKYFIYSFTDENKDLKYTSPNELIGYLNDTINLKSNIEKISIPLQKFDLRNLRVNRIGDEKGNATVEFNKGIKTLKLSYPDSKQRVYYTLNKEQNKVEIYNSQNSTDSIPLKIFSEDSFNIQLDTLVKIFFPKEEEKKIDKKNKEEKKTIFNIDIQPDNKKILTTKDIVIKSEYPVEKIKIDKIYFFKDSLAKYNLEDSSLQWNNNLTEAKVLSSVSFTDTIHLKIEYGALINIKGDTNKLYNGIFVRKKSEQFSSIGGEVRITNNSFIIQLIKKGNKEPLEIKNQRNFKFDFLDPGVYTLRVLVDENQNGQWDRGELMNRIEPEKIIHYKITDNKGNPTSEINLKANWEILDNVIQESE